MNNQRQHGRGLKHNTPAHVSTKRNRLQWWAVWNSDGQMEISKLTSLLSAKSVGGRFSGSRLSHLHQVLPKIKIISTDVPYVSHAGQRAVHVADPRALTLPVNSDMCVRRWRTAGRKISCCLNKRDQLEAGVLLRRRRTRGADNVTLMMLLY